MRILAFELRKIATYRPFWAVFGFYLTMIFIGTWVISKLASLDLGQASLSPLQVFRYPSVWGNFAFGMKIANLPLALLVAILVCNEFEYKTMRQHVINGFDRWQIHAGQLVLVGFFALLCVGSVLAVGGIFGLSGEGEAFNQSVALNLLGLFAYTVAHLLFMVFLALCFRRAGTTIIFWFLFHVAFEPLVAYLMDKQLEDDPSKFLPFHAIAKLVPDPQFYSTTIATIENQSWALGGGYIVVFSLLCLARLRWTDI